MSTAHFSADWLQQREPFDAAARSSAAGPLHLDAFVEAVRPEPGRPWRVVDLACGMGANLRWLAPRLGGEQQWLVVDHDADLLRRWPAHFQQPTRALERPLRWTAVGCDVSVVRQQTDLMTGLEALPWAAADVVTASALLDLVGLPWLQRLAGAAAQHRTPLLMALNVDGRHIWSLQDPADAKVGRLFARHQARDKGMGRALGAAAIPALQSTLQALGYRVHTAVSDWYLDGRTDPGALQLQRALIAGMASAAMEQDRRCIDQVMGWRERRWALADQTVLRVGHLDLCALPS